MNRLPDWPERLFAFIESRREAAFSWGANDCCIFCADAILEITGEDLAAELRGSYSDEQGAAAVLEKFGGMEGLATHFLGEALGPLCARRGDVALIVTRHGPAIGICTGNHIAVPGDVEQIMFPLEQALKSWRVA